MRGVKSSTTHPAVIKATTAAVTFVMQKSRRLSGRQSVGAFDNTNFKEMDCRER
jgi:hypothetical protein